MEEIEGATPSDVVNEVVAEETLHEEVEQAEETPKTIDDTIRDTLRAINERNATPEDAVEKANRIRDEKGKFSKPEPIPESSPSEPVRAAPNTWKKAAQEKWATIPKDIQEEIYRREDNIHQGIEGYKSKAQFGESIEKAIAPYSATLQALNMSPDRAVSELLAMDAKLRSGTPQEKHLFFAHLAKTCGVNLENLASVANQPIDPNVQYFQQKIGQLENQLQQQTFLSQQRTEQELNSEIAKFSTDPKNRHFDSVRDDMASLLQAGVAKTLQDAYEQAIWRNPTVRASLVAEQQETARKEAAQKAQKAKQAASVNIRNRPSMPVSQPIGTMDDTIRATLRRLQS